MIDKCLNLDDIPSLIQRQDSVTDQLTDLKYVAGRLGMYDAAEFIQRHLEHCQAQNTPQTATLESTYFQYAQHKALDDPAGFRVFRDRCRKVGKQSALAECHLSEDLPVLMFWARYLERITLP